MAFLVIKGLGKNFGGLRAVNALDMNVKEGDIVALIGPNGAGKSTVLNMIGGTLVPSKGKIVFNGMDITKMPAYRRAKLGIARVFQRNALFGSMTVLENVLSGGYLKNKYSIREIFFKINSDLERTGKYIQKALDLLDFVGLKKQSNELAVNLPHGSQRKLCIALAMASDPKLLLLDEPLTGMHAEEITEMIEIVRSLNNEKGVTSIVVEHNMKAVLGMCEHTVVLNYGQKMLEADSPKECIENPDVIEAYLGADTDVF